tara:strand:+ start:159 stop:281 length:123 start_codon:yes stop_codon:yes gene_type:complete
MNDSLRFSQLGERRKLESTIHKKLELVFIGQEEKYNIEAE